MSESEERTPNPQVQKRKSDAGCVGSRFMLPSLQELLGFIVALHFLLPSVCLCTVNMRLQPSVEVEIAE